MRYSKICLFHRRRQVTAARIWYIFSNRIYVPKTIINSCYYSNYGIKPLRVKVTEDPDTNNLRYNCYPNSKLKSLRSKIIKHYNSNSFRNTKNNSISLRYLREYI